VRPVSLGPLARAARGSRLTRAVPLADYTTTISYGEGNPTAESGFRNELGLMEDHLFVPLVVEEQFVPTTSLELDVWFDGASSFALSLLAAQ